MLPVLSILLKAWVIACVLLLLLKFKRVTRFFGRQTPSAPKDQAPLPRD